MPRCIRGSSPPGSGEGATAYAAPASCSSIATLPLIGKRIKRGAIGGLAFLYQERVCGPGKSLQEAGITVDGDPEQPLGCAHIIARAGNILHETSLRQSGKHGRMHGSSCACMHLHGTFELCDRPRTMNHRFKSMRMNGLFRAVGDSVKEGPFGCSGASSESGRVWLSPRRTIQ
jgi:hypothetical protein